MESCEKFNLGKRANGGVNLRKDASQCDGSPLDSVPLIDDFPCSNPMFTGLQVDHCSLNKQLHLILIFRPKNYQKFFQVQGFSFDVFNYNHQSIEEAMEFCESRDQILLPLLIDFPASQSVLTEVSEQIGYLNYEHPEVEFWIPYKQENGEQTLFNLKLSPILN